MNGYSRPAILPDDPDNDPNLRALARDRDRMLGQLDQSKREAAVRQDPAYPLTFAEAVDLYLQSPRGRSIKNPNERRSLIRRNLTRFIGHLPVAAITHREITACLEKSAERKLSRGSLVHIRQAANQVVTHCWKKGYVDRIDWLQKVEIPDAPTEGRQRETLTDDEFFQLVRCEAVPFRFRVMCVAARCIGGMRTSDLHAWDWAQLDVENWIDCYVPRPKTSRFSANKPRRRIEIPELARPFLKEYWLSQGRPRSGAVFGRERPSRKGAARVGEAKTFRGMSYAKRLRRYLKIAGVTRERLFVATPDSLPVDFHSWRRAYSTATTLALRGDLKQVMELTGHSQVSTLQR